MLPFNEAIKDKVLPDNFAPGSNQTKLLSDPDINGSKIENNNPNPSI